MTLKMTSAQVVISVLYESKVSNKAMEIILFTIYLINIVDLRGRKYVFGPTQAHFYLRTSGPQN